MRVLRERLRERRRARGGQAVLREVERVEPGVVRQGESHVRQPLVAEVLGAEVGRGPGAELVGKAVEARALQAEQALTDVVAVVQLLQLVDARPQPVDIVQLAELLVERGAADGLERRVKSGGAVAAERGAELKEHRPHVDCGAAAACVCQC